MTEQVEKHVCATLNAATLKNVLKIAAIATLAIVGAACIGKEIGQTLLDILETK
jgi:hypothetical protein